MPPTITPQELVAKWRGDTRKERSVSQEHFIDLCRLLVHPTPGESRDGSLAFEEGADKQRGGQGWADVWKKGFFAWEYKGPHANLDKALQQLLQYRESLQNPPLLVVSDLQQIVIHTNFTNTVKQVFTITLDDLLKPTGQQRLRDLFYAPEAFRARRPPPRSPSKPPRSFPNWPSCYAATAKTRSASRISSSACCSVCSPKTSACFPTACSPA